MTESSREQHIVQALRDYEERMGDKDTLRVPLRGYTLLRAIELPLEVPVLNAESFRIAPLLADHPAADLVRADPHSPAAQEIVATLVRYAHRHAEELKESLKDGQDQPGVITRKGVLINANTRCVLLRELLAEGEITTNVIRVAVLPDVTNAELLDLEAVLQKQREYKDDYNLVSELMMLKTLYDKAGMTEQQIAKRQRLGKPTEVTDRLDILALMERARRLPGRTLPLSRFAQDEDQLQNWKELLKRVREAEQSPGPDAADHIVRGWLFAYTLGYDSVHKLRHANGRWIEKDVVENLVERGDTSADIAHAVVAPASDEEPEAADELEGMDLLDPGGNGKPGADEATVQRLLDLTLDAVAAEDGGTVVLPDGEERPAGDVLETLRASAGYGLEASKRRSQAGNRLARPANLLTHARSDVRDALDSVDDVLDDVAFAPQIKALRALAEEVSDLADEMIQLLADADKPSAAEVS
jgi:hypothetical protein